MTIGKRNQRGRLFCIHTIHPGARDGIKVIIADATRTRRSIHVELSDLPNYYLKDTERQLNFDIFFSMFCYFLGKHMHNSRFQKPRMLNMLCRLISNLRYRHTSQIVSEVPQKILYAMGLADYCLVILYNAKQVWISIHI